MANNTTHRRPADDVKEKECLKSSSAPTPRHRYKSWGNVSFLSDESEIEKTAAGHHLLNPTLSSQLSYRQLSILLKSANLPENHRNNLGKASFTLKQSILRNSVICNDPLFVQNQNLSFKDVTARLIPKMWNSLKSRLFIHETPQKYMASGGEVEASGITKNNMKEKEKDSTEIDNTVRRERKAFTEKSLASSRHRVRRNSFTEGSVVSRVDNVNRQAISFSRQQRRRSFSEGSCQYLVGGVILKPVSSDSLVPEPPARYLLDSIGAISIDFLEDIDHAPNRRTKTQSLPEPHTFSKFKRSSVKSMVCSSSDKRASTLVVGFDDLEFMQKQKNKNDGLLSHAFGRSKENKLKYETKSKHIPKFLEEKISRKRTGFTGISINQRHEHDAEVLTTKKRQQEGGICQPKQPARYREDSIGGVSISFLCSNPK